MKQSSLQTPRARVKYMGSARSGTEVSWGMRVSSLALLPLTFTFVVIVAMLAKADLADARALLGSPIPALLLLLFIIAGVWHMALGLRSVIEDYVSGEHARGLALAANSCIASGIGLACVYAMLRLSFVQ